MRLDHITFDEEPALPEAAPLDMDAVAFVGFVAERKPVFDGPDLTRFLTGLGVLTKAEKAGGVASLIGRPVPIGSITAYEALFDGGTRLDHPAEIVSAALPDTIAAVDLALPLVLIINGVLQEITLPALASTPEDIAAHLTEAGIEASILRRDGEAHLRLGLAQSAGPGRISVLAYPPLGFAAPQNSQSQRVGCAMDAALRQFFAMGGRLAYVVSLGAPLPLLASRSQRTGALAQMLGIEGVGENLIDAPLPPPHLPAATRQGIVHLFSLPEASFLVLPDLADLCAAPRREPSLQVPPAGPVPVFAECIPSPAPVAMSPLRDMGLPACDAAGLALWQVAVARIQRLLGDHRRDMHVLLALPRVMPGVDLAAALPHSAFVMLTAPAARTPFSADLPSQAMGADAVLAGQLAALLSSATPHGSAAARPVPCVQGLAEPTPDLDICALTYDTEGCLLARDVTTSPDPSWRAGPASRMAARLLRQAQIVGQDILFEPISGELQRRVILGFSSVLAEIGQQGGLRDSPSDPGYEVVCDSRTMTEADRDQGILRAEVSFRPALPIEAIRLILPMPTRAPQSGVTP